MCRNGPHVYQNYDSNSHLTCENLEALRASTIRKPEQRSWVLSQSGKTACIGILCLHFKRVPQDLSWYFGFLGEMVLRSKQKVQAIDKPPPRKGNLFCAAGWTGDFIYMSRVLSRLGYMAIATNKSGQDVTKSAQYYGTMLRLSPRKFFSYTRCIMYDLPFVVYLPYIRLTAIPPILFQLSKIKHISLSHNRISRIPDGIVHLSRSLEVLDLSSNVVMCVQTATTRLYLCNRSRMFWTNSTSWQKWLGEQTSMNVFRKWIYMHI